MDIYDAMNEEMAKGCQHTGDERRQLRAGDAESQSDSDSNQQEERLDSKE